MMLGMNRCVSAFAFVLIDCAAFYPVTPPISSSRRIREPIAHIVCDFSVIPSYSCLSVASKESEILHSSETMQLPYKDTDALNDAVHRLCRAGELDDALQLIRKVEDSQDTMDSTILDQSTYAAVMNAYARSDSDDAGNQAEKILSSMSCTPKGQAYSAAILAWSNSKHSDAAQKAESLLTELWSLYNSTQDKAYLPTRATYTSVITAWARSDQSKAAAERAEELLEEMEAYYRDGFRILGPTTACVNAVLNAWSKSNDKRAPDRCEVILERMEALALEGRTELQPDTVSFNTVIDALAQSGQRGAQRRAEVLLERMEVLSKGETSFPCDPDTLSFNVVINSWAKSREAAAAHRADAILRHMEKRYEMAASNVAPDCSTYNSVIHAWSRNKEFDAPQRADAVLKRMESAYKKGNAKAHADSTTYNSLINVWAKSKDPRAGDRALEILQLMKKFQKEDCRPDVFTYTSVIDAFSKYGSPYAADQAVSLLTELEEEYQRTREECLKPNVRTYTSAINAIARGRQRPERAEAILDRLESLYGAGELDVQPDAACYNAVINAWGWSDKELKSQRAYKLYQRMVDAFESGKNPNVKPDIITCNSILNACAFGTAKSDADRAATMDIAVQCLEAFQAPAPKYGWPNHVTYSNMLLTIARQMPKSDRRLDLAEATFWQCCNAGHVSPLVISHLRNVLLGTQRLKTILGSALFVNRDDNFSYDMRKLPREWRRFAPRQNDRSRQGGRGSRQRTRTKSSEYS